MRTDYLTPIKGIAVQLGLRCPLACRHCYVSAGPERPERLALQSLGRIVHGFGRSNIMPKVLALTGGEPFMYLDALHFVLAESAPYDIQIHITTSAFFATSQRRAFQLLLPFQRIAALEVSIDHEHEEFVPRERAINALRAALELGVPCHAAVQRAQWEHDQTLRDDLAELQGVGIYKQAFAPVGDRNNANDQKQYLLPKILSGGCKKVGSIVFDENGFAYPCCSSVLMAKRADVSPEISHLCLGSIDDYTFDEIISHFERSTHLRMMSLIGPNVAAKILRGRSTSPHETTYCDACIAISTKSTINEEKRAFLSSLVDFAAKL